MRPAVLSLALGTLAAISVVGVSTPVSADHRYQGWGYRDHWRYRDYYRPYYYYPRPPRVIFVPPPVAYAPPPVYYEPPYYSPYYAPQAGFSFSFGR